MKKIILLIMIVCVWSTNNYLYATDYLSYNEETSECIELTNGITNIHTTGTTNDDSGNVDKQNINALIKDVDDNVIVTSWANVNNSYMGYMTVADLAIDFELNNPGYEVIGGINGDYFTSGTTVNATSIFGGDIVKLQNHSKYFNINVSQNGELLGETKEVEYLGYQLNVYNDDKIVYTTSIDGFNDETKETTIYYNYTPNTSDDIYLVSDLDTNLELSGKYLLKGQITSSYQTGKISTDELGVKTTDINLLELLKNNPEIRVQPMIKNNQYLNSNMIGVGSKILSEGTVLSAEEIVDQYSGFALETHPRTSIGFTEDGGVVLATFDGRQSLSPYGVEAVGVNLRESALVMKEFGCVSAFNLDGGGSTQMIIKGENGEFEYVNSPSEQYRTVQSAIFFVKPINLSSATTSIVNLTADSVDMNLSYTLPNNAVVSEIKLMVNNNESTLSSLDKTIKIESMDINKANSIIIEIKYLIGTKEYTEQLINQIVNLDSKTGDRETVMPENFEMSFAKIDDGVKISISYEDNDEFIEMLMIKNLKNNQILTYKDDEDFILSNLIDGETYSFTISYSYRVDGVLNVMELADVYEYTYNINEVIPDDTPKNDIDDSDNEFLIPSIIIIGLIGIAGVIYIVCRKKKDKK